MFAIPGAPAARARSGARILGVPGPSRKVVTEVTTRMDDVAMRELTDHLRMHMKYPTTKQQIVDECNHMAHVPESTRRMVEDKLPDRAYQTADEVMRALGM